MGRIDLGRSGRIAVDRPTSYTYPGHIHMEQVFFSFIFPLRFFYFPDFSAALHFSCPRFYFAFFLSCDFISNFYFTSVAFCKRRHPPGHYAAIPMGGPTTDNKTRNTHVDGDRRRKNTAMDRPTKHVATLACVRARERARASERPPPPRRARGGENVT